MARKNVISEVELKQAKVLRDNATTVTDFRKALVVILGAELSIDADKISKILGTSRRTVFRDRIKIRNQDLPKKNSWGGRRRCSMTFEEEKEFLSQWEEKAATGGILSVPPIHTALIERLDRKIPLSTTYRLLARHGWRKVQPDTKHPKSDPVAQEDYKKNYLKRWLPPA
jgi:transposase